MILSQENSYMRTIIRLISNISEVDTEPRKLIYKNNSRLISNISQVVTEPRKLIYKNNSKVDF